MYGMLRLFRLDDAGEFPEIPTDITDSELDALGTNGDQRKVAEALRILMARHDPDRLKLAQEAGKWVAKSKPFDNRLCVHHLVRVFMSMQAMVDGKQMRLCEAKLAFGRHFDTARILCDDNSGLTQVERAGAIAALYTIASKIHKKQEAHFGAIVPERHYASTSRRPCGPKDPVLVDAKFLNGLMATAGMVERTVVVERCSDGPAEPVWFERKETVHLPAGSPELAKLDAMIAKKKAEHAARDSDEEDIPASPAYYPQSPSYGPYDSCYGV